MLKKEVNLNLERRSIAAMATLALLGACSGSGDAPPAEYCKRCPCVGQ